MYTVITDWAISLCCNNEKKNKNKRNHQDLTTTSNDLISRKMSVTQITSFSLIWAITLSYLEGIGIKSNFQQKKFLHMHDLLC